MTGPKAVASMSRARDRETDSRIAITLRVLAPGFRVGGKIATLCREILDGIVQDTVTGLQRLGDLTYKEIEPQVALCAGRIELADGHRGCDGQEIPDKGRECLCEYQVIALKAAKLAGHTVEAPCDGRVPLVVGIASEEGYDS